jgi:hypothetical protein
VGLFASGRQKGLSKAMDEMIPKESASDPYVMPSPNERK